MIKENDGVVVYTTNFARVKNLPAGVCPVSICGKPPFPWNGLRYPKLMPKKGFFMEWKKNGDNDFYVRHFNDEVLSAVTQDGVVSELVELTKSRSIALCCLENPADFCHRHLVSEWLREAGYVSHEFVGNTH